MADYKQISDNCPDGALIGNASTSKVGFFGATPVARQTTATTPTNSGAWATDGTAVVAAVVAIKTALDNLGVTA